MKMVYVGPLFIGQIDHTGGLGGSISVYRFTAFDGSSQCIWHEDEADAWADANEWAEKNINKRWYKGGFKTS